MMEEVIPDSLFYSGGTISTKDIIKTSNTCNYDIALNSDHMFLLKKGSTNCKGCQSGISDRVYLQDYEK